MKHNYPVIGTLLIGLVLVACASDPAVPADASSKQANTTSGNGDELVCTREVPVGTNFSVKKCRTRAQIAAENAAGADAISHAGSIGSPAK
jgi:hypothetical protein